MNDCEVLYILF